VSSQPPVNVPPNPTIPLSPPVRAAYEDLRNQLQAAIESTADVATLEALNAAYPQVDDVLTKDDEYRLNANTTAFNALLGQIKDTNDQLKTLQSQIQSIASHFKTAGAILAAINKIFTLVSAV
jgi:hypothetical protein